MPAPANPLRRDFFVYIFRADGYPFYVGIGRDKRASDRLRYIRSLTPAQLAEKTLKDRVMAALDRQTIITFSRTRLPLNRKQALAIEKLKIQQLLRKGYHLTNEQHNPHWDGDGRKALRAILGKKLRPSDHLI